MAGVSGGGQGSIDGDVFCPKGCDTTLQNDDQWFYTPDYPLRSLQVTP